MFDVFAAQPRRVPVAGVAVDGAAGDVPRRRRVHGALARAVRARRAAGAGAHGARRAHHWVRAVRFIIINE